ncbi:MAG: polysaccharide pyruvyl transferase family protein [Acidobacteria bacterium]|nr:polysaccharide pyruvyl transferase family protein [Acidobacteriota bacterium]
MEGSLTSAAGLMLSCRQVESDDEKAPHIPSPAFTLGQVGTFDVENYGDLLYPVVLRRILERRGARVRLLPYSNLDGDAPLAAGFKTRALRELFDANRPQPRAVLVGGGDILRTDKELVAEHYRVAQDGRPGELLRTLGTTGLLQYLVRRRLPPPRASNFYAARFNDRWMSQPGPGPFLIDREDLPGAPPVCYLSCGVPHEFSTAERERVADTFDKADFIYLRDEQSRAKLLRAGVHAPIRVAPDLIVTLEDFFPRETEARRGRDILSRCGVDVTRPVLCFQCKPHTGFSPEEVVGQLALYRERTGAEVALLPLGYCHGDQLFLSEVAKKAEGAFKLVGVGSVYDMLAVIAAGSIFVGTSMHGNITALSYGLPHLYGPLAVDKAEGFLSGADLPDALKLRSWSELNDRIDFAFELGPDFFAGRARAAKEKVYRAVDELLAVVPN